LARANSGGGLRAVTNNFHGDDRRTVEDAYCATYHTFAPIIAELYDEVRSGNEVASVRLAIKRLEYHPMPTVDRSRMWAVRRKGARPRQRA
jgi:ketol-acid reductoisomerase